MAHGDFMDQTRRSSNTFIQRYKLLDAAAGTTDGQWVDVRGFKRFSLHITGTGTATLQVRGSNELAMPDNSSHAAQIGADVTNPAADSVISVDVPLSFIKIRVSAYTNGTYSVFAVAQAE